MGTSGLPDITGPRAEGVYIRQTTSVHGITIMLYAPEQDAALQLCSHIFLVKPKHIREIAKFRKLE